MPPEHDQHHFCTQQKDPERKTNDYKQCKNLQLLKQKHLPLNGTWLIENVIYKWHMTTSKNDFDQMHILRLGDDEELYLDRGMKTLNQNYVFYLACFCPLENALQKKV